MKQKNIAKWIVTIIFRHTKFQQSSSIPKRVIQFFSFPQSEDGFFYLSSCLCLKSNYCSYIRTLGKGLFQMLSLFTNFLILIMLLFFDCLCTKVIHNERNYGANVHILAFFCQCFFIMSLNRFHEFTQVAMLSIYLTKILSTPALAPLPSVMAIKINSANSFFKRNAMWLLEFLFSINAKFSEKLIFLILWYEHACRLEILVSPEILLKY